MIYITTKNRWEDIRTLRYLAKELTSKIRIVVQFREYKKYKKKYPDYRFVVLPADIKKLEPTREFLWKYSKRKGRNKFFLVDDDCLFYERTTHEPPIRSKVMTRHATYKMFSKMYRLLDEYAHVGISEKLGNNRTPEPYKSNTRYVRVLGYNLDLIPLNKIEFGRTVCMSDYDMNLQLLRLGLESRVCFLYSQDHRGSNTKGGCSVYRTPEVLATSAKKLSWLHPGFVSVVKKKTKKAWFGEGKERVDVRIQWKKAYESSQR